MDMRKARVIRTKALLKSAFISLMDTHPPHEITVVDLCRAADLNRSTFYAHYGCPDDLIREILSDCVAEVCSGPVRRPSEAVENGGVHRKRIEDYLDAFLANDTLLKFCTCEDSDLFRADIVRIQVGISVESNLDPVLYYPAFFQNSGVLNMILEWIKNCMPVPRGQLIEIIHQFSKAMYYPYE